MCMQYVCMLQTYDGVSHLYSYTYFKHNLEEMLNNNFSKLGRCLKKSGYVNEYLSTRILVLKELPKYFQSVHSPSRFLSNSHLTGHMSEG